MEFTSWKKSTRSQDSQDCVEVSPSPDRAFAGVRDSKDTAGPALAFTSTDWQSFTDAAKAGQFDL